MALWNDMMFEKKEEQNLWLGGPGVTANIYYRGVTLVINAPFLTEAEQCVTCQSNWGAGCSN